MQTVNVEIRPAWRNYWPGFLLAAGLFFAAMASLFMLDNAVLFAALLSLTALVTLAWLAIQRLSWKFTIDEQRVSRHYGLISRNQQSVRIRDMRSIELDQSIFQRIFGIGDLAFYSAGSAEAEVRFVGIKDPGYWRSQVEKVMDHAKTSNE